MRRIPRPSHNGRSGRPISRLGPLDDAPEAARSPRRCDDYPSASPVALRVALLPPASAPAGATAKVTTAPRTTAPVMRPGVPGRLASTASGLSLPSRGGRSSTGRGQGSAGAAPAHRRAGERSRRVDGAAGCLNRPGIGGGSEPTKGWGHASTEEVSAGRRPGTSTAEASKVKDLEREVRELKRANEVLLAASSFFARSWTRDCRGSRVHRRPPGAVRGPTDL